MLRAVFVIALLAAVAFGQTVTVYNTTTCLSTDPAAFDFVVTPGACMPWLDTDTAVQDKCVLKANCSLLAGCAAGGTKSAAEILTCMGCNTTSDPKRSIIYGPGTRVRFYSGSSCNQIILDYNPNYNPCTTAPFDGLCGTGKSGVSAFAASASAASLASIL